MRLIQAICCKMILIIVHNHIYLCTWQFVYVKNLKLGVNFLQGELLIVNLCSVIVVATKHHFEQSGIDITREWFDFNDWILNWTFKPGQFPQCDPFLLKLGPLWIVAKFVRLYCCSLIQNLNFSKLSLAKPYLIWGELTVSRIKCHKIKSFDL